MAKKDKKDNDKVPTSPKSGLDSAKKQKYIKKFQEEKLSAIKARQVRINNWLQNEQMYNGVATITLLTRSNLHVPKVFETVQTTSSKIGQLPDVEFETKPEGDENSMELMKACFDEDMDDSDADQVAQDSKIEAGLYGRAIYKLIPSNEGCKIALIDTMSFLINPTAKKVKDSIYCGQQFIYKTMDQIEADAKEFGYNMDEVQSLKDFKEPSETSANYSEEKSLKDLRLSYLGYANTTQLGAKMIVLNEWYTMIDKKWHVMTVANDRFLLRCVPVTEVGLKRPPYISWATYPRAVVFWTPSPADISRDPNLAMDVSLNQLIDNNTYRNFGMTFVSSSSGLKQSSIVPRPLGVTPVALGPNQSIKDVVLPNQPPEIGDAMATMNAIGSMSDNAVGTSVSAPPGQKGKLSATQQAQLQGVAEAKTNLLKQNFVKAWEEVGQEYADIVKRYMTTPRKVKVRGKKDLTIEGVTKKNFAGVEFIAKATSPEISQENKAIKQKASQAMFEIFKDDPKVTGQQFLREKVAKAFDFTPSDIDKLFSEEEGQTPAAPQTPATPTAPSSPAPTNIPTGNPNPAPVAQVQSAAQTNVPQGIK